MGTRPGEAPRPSRRPLLALASEFGLYAQQRRAGASETALVEQMRSDISIVPAPTRSPNSVATLRVIFQGTSPKLAAQVANRLSWLLVLEDARERESGAAATAQFLAEQTTSPRRRVESVEAALRDFKVRYSGETPEHEESLKASARSLREELKSLRRSALRLEQERIVLEQAVKTAAGPEHAISSAPQAPPAEAPPAESRSEQLRSRLALLRAVYKDDHPYVRRLLAELAHVQELEKAAKAHPAEQSEPSAGQRAGNGWHGRSEQPALASGDSLAHYRERLSMLDQQLQNLAVQQAQRAAELGSVEQRLSSLPLRRQQMASLLRDQASYSADLKLLAGKKTSAETAAAMETHCPPERLSVLDEARIPTRPFGPDRGLVALAASLAALGIAAVVALAQGIAQGQRLGAFSLPWWIAGDLEPDYARELMLSSSSEHAGRRR